jgi:stage II sporulation protein D
MIRAALALTLSFMGLQSPVLAADSSDPLVRIGLVRYFSGAQKISVRSDAHVTLRDPVSGKKLAFLKSGTLTISLLDNALSYTGDHIRGGSSQAIALVADHDGGIQMTSEIGRDAHWHRYRGTLSIAAGSSEMTVVDSLGVEEYVYGVLAAEIGKDAPPEALKAQAVAARTYALKNRGRFGAQGFDVDDTTRSQGYLGMDGETPETAAAVDATRGEVLTYAGQLIEAPYSTDSGGVTACDSTGKCPYLQPVIDSPGPGMPDYAGTSVTHEWDLEMSAATLEKALAADPRTHVAHFLCLTLDSLDASGRITTATVSDNDGTMKTVPGSVLRQILGNDQLRSTRVTLTVRANGDYVFHGKGWGHGLGMSQLGAKAMAAPPYNHTYREILEHYYVGAVCQPDGSVPSLGNVPNLRPAAALPEP